MRTIGTILAITGFIIVVLVLWAYLSLRSLFKSFKYQVQVNNISFKNTGVVADILVKVTNNTNRDITLRNTKLFIYKNGALIGQSVGGKTITLKANTINEFIYPVQFFLSRAAGAFFDETKNGDFSFDYTIQTSVYYLPLSYSDTYTFIK